MSSRSAARPVERAPATGYALAVVAASLFAWLGPLSRWAYERGMEPVGFVGWRAGIGAVALAAVLVVAREGLGRLAGIPSRERLVLAVATMMALSLNLFVFAAFARTSVALALIGFYTYPAMVALVAILLGRDRPTPGALVALMLATAGMVLVVAGSMQAEAAIRLEPLGFALALGAAASQTVFVTISRDGYPSVPTQAATAVILGGSALGCIAIALAAGLAPELALPAARPADLLPIVLVAGVLVAAVPSVLFLTAIRRIGGTRAGIVMLLEPVVGVALAAALLGEALRPVQLAGGAAVLTAALLLQVTSAPRASAGSGTG